jgi:hypothetical protein
MRLLTSRWPLYLVNALARHYGVYEPIETRGGHCYGSGNIGAINGCGTRLRHPQTACAAARKPVNLRGNTPAFTVP